MAQFEYRSSDGIKMNNKMIHLWSIDMETAVTISVVSLIVNILMGLIMFFAKYTVDDLKDKLKVHQEAIDRIRDTYIKREDFREFKEELFVRLDEMKLDFKHEVERLKQ